MTAERNSATTPIHRRLLYGFTNWSLFVAGMVNLGVGTWSAANGNAAIAATSLTAGLVLLFAATIDRFESLKGLGIEAKTRKLDEKIEQADEALRRLRELTELTGAALVDLNSKMGRWDSAPSPREALALAERVRSIMHGLGSELRRVIMKKFRKYAVGVVLLFFVSLAIPLQALAAAEGAAGAAGFMMFPGDYTWSAAVRGAIGASIGGGGELGEINKVCVALKGKSGDNAAWFTEWNKMGEKVALLADQAKEKGHKETASAAYMRAAHYIEIGERLRQPRTPETQAAYARAVELFKKGALDASFLSIEPVEVPFEGGKSLPAYFVKKKGAPAARYPTIVFFDGLDVTKEILYFRIADIVKRGMACLLVDGPGNGESIRFRGMPGRYDAEVAGTAAVNYLETRTDVDKDRLAIMGVSLGGYFAPRIAAFEKRYKACVAWGAAWDYHAVWKARVDAAFKTALSVPGEHIAWFLGVKTMDEALKKLEPWTLEGVAGKVQCPFLLTHGEADAQVSMDIARKEFAEIGSKDKTFKVFTREEGGSEHCQGDNFTIGIAYIADWLADKLKK